jgi:hypothetical protein
MKIFMINWTKALTMVLMLGIIAYSECENCSINPDNPAPDPEGTVTVNISESTRIDVGNSVDRFNYAGIKWTDPNNFYLKADHLYCRVSICDLGIKPCLGNIAIIPSTGFTVPAGENNSVVCEPGHGYVVKFEGGVYPLDIIYVRLYVTEYIVNATGNIVGAKVKYQYPFKPAS